MRKKLSLGLALLLILMVVSATYNPGAAVTYTVGVPVGTAADYSYSQTDVTLNKIHLDVTGVSASVITMTRTVYNPSGSVNNTHSGLTFNVTSNLAVTQAYWWFVAANLTVGTPVYPASTLYFIGETITNFPIAGADRTVNHMNKTVSGITINAWWDKPTGLMVKWRWHQFSPSDWWVNFTLTGTSVWTPGYGAGGLSGLSTTTLLLIGAGAVVVIAIAAIALRRRK